MATRGKAGAGIARCAGAAKLSNSNFKRMLHANAVCATGMDQTACCTVQCAVRVRPLVSRFYARVMAEFELYGMPTT